MFRMHVYRWTVTISFRGSWREPAVGPLMALNHFLEIEKHFREAPRFLRVLYTELAISSSDTLIRGVTDVNFLVAAIDGITRTNFYVVGP
jgi:hypothetical protein